MVAPAALIAIPLLAGCTAGILLVDWMPAALPLRAAVGALLAVLAAAAWLDDRRSAETCAAIAIGAGLVGLSLGFGASRDALRPPLLEWFEATGEVARDEPVLLDVVLREDAALTDYGAALWGEVIGIGRPGGTLTPCCRGGVRLSIGGEAIAEFSDAWRAGRIIRVPATLRLPTEYRNPGVPDARRGQALRGVVLTGSVKSGALVEVVASGGAVREAAGHARAWTRRVLQRHIGIRSERSAAIASAILVNDRSGLEADDERRLQEAGTYHVIAISGGNIAILTVMLLSTARLAGLRPAPASLWAIVALIFYAHLTGAPASVARAVTAAVVYLAGRVLDQRGPPLNALAVAGAIAVAWWPLTAIDAGFILSFGATLGILLGTPGLVRALAGAVGATQGVRREPIVRRAGRQAWLAAAGVLSATVCAELALAPVGASLFARVTLAGLVVNFAAVPLMTLTQLAAIATLAVSVTGDRVAAIPGAVADAAAWGLVESARLVDVAPWLAHEVARPPWTLIIVYYAICLWLLAARRRMAAALCAGAAYLSLVALPLPLTRDAQPPRPGYLRAVFLDVGQGDATLVTLPDGRALLVDAGGVPATSFDFGGRVVAPALRAFGVRRLDEIVITHADTDHIGGALSLARRFRPRTIREGAPVPPNEDLRALAAYAAASGAAWRTVQAGDVDRVAGVDIRVWHPPIPDWERQRVRNDDSIVLEFRYGEVSIVLPGDIGREPEEALAPRLELAPLVVLKVPHHGSAGSSSAAFVRAIRPAAVVVNAGRHNRFGHPAPVVLGRYRAAGAEIFRTDEDGAVIVETDGRAVVVRTWSGRWEEIGRAPVTVTRAGWPAAARGEIR
jgi:competence protein ComEC